MQAKRLRFGVMCMGTTFPAWQAQCLEELMALERVELKLLILPDAPSAPRNSVGQKIKNLRKLKGRLWSHYNRYVDAHAAAKRPVDLSVALAGVPQMKCKVVRKGKFSEYFTESDLAVIREHHLDFILRFAFNIIRGEILKVTPYGVWSFHHGNINQFRGGPPCFWEIYFGVPATGVTLQRLNDRLDGGVVLKIDTFPTIHSSYGTNRDMAHFLGAGWPAEVCRGLLNGDEGGLNDPPTLSNAPVYVLPTNSQMTVFFLSMLRNRLFQPRCRAYPQTSMRVDATANGDYDASMGKWRSK